MGKSMHGKKKSENTPVDGKGSCLSGLQRTEMKMWPACPMGAEMGPQVSLTESQTSRGESDEGVVAEEERPKVRQEVAICVTGATMRER